MKSTTSVLVYEFLSAGGLGDVEAGAAPAGGADGRGGQTSLLAQGVAMRAALVADLAAHDAVSVTAVDSALAPLSATNPPVAIIRPRRGEAAPAFLSRLAPAFDRVWVVAPETDGILANLHEAVGPQRWVGCAAEAIVLTSSKHATCELLGAHGIATPRQWRPGRPLPPASAAWVVKPDDGAGGEHTRVFDRFEAARREFEARLSHGQRATLEAWVVGEALSLSLLMTSRGTELLSVNRQHIVLGGDGVLHYAGVDIAIEPATGAAALVQLVHRVAAAVPGLAGFVGIDLVRGTDGKLVVIEINPRLTCAYVGLPARLGRGLAAEIVLAGCAHPPPTDGSPLVPRRDGKGDAPDA